MSKVFNITSITQFHQIIDLPAPDHPLISIIWGDEQSPKGKFDKDVLNMKLSSDMYLIKMKDDQSGSIGYGRTSYDYQEGTLLFVSPGQVVDSPGVKEADALRKDKGWTLLFHPDLIQNSNLGTSIDNYSYFSYEVNEALHLSKKERAFILEIINQIKEEYQQNLDAHSQKLIISNLELLLNYCTRFFDRQFYTRSNLNKNFVTEFETLLNKYFSSDQLAENGVPSVKVFGEKMNMSANYLSDLLKKETGKTVKQYINDKIVRKAKSILLNSNSSIGEIAYDLGFQYPQSFTRLFKKNTGISPYEFRRQN